MRMRQPRAGSTRIVGARRKAVSSIHFLIISSSCSRLSPLSFLMRPTIPSCALVRVEHYGSHAYATDRFVEDYPDFLILFSASNHPQAAKVNSVTTPCLAKNSLCVGSTNSDHERTGVTGADPVLRVKSSVHPLEFTLEVAFANFGPLWAIDPVRMESTLVVVSQQS